MFEERGDCAVCDGWGWLISGRRADGKPLFKRCEFCNRNRRNRLILLAFVALLIAFLILVKYLWII
jgi:hypothetical protein